MSDDRALLDKFVDNKNVFNPDILDCIANLSNDEVFTPPKLVNEVLDTLPPEIWHDSKITFLDPACKSGVWLREVTKRLIDGLADEMPDLQERIDHILHKQVFGIAITELTSLLSRRSLYCSKYPNGRYSISRFDDVSGNIWYQNIDHKWKNGRCVLCGANQSEYDRSEDKNSYAYGFIHIDPHYWEEVFGVKFDVIIGNPPYQLSTGASTAQATPIYDKFVYSAFQLSPRYVAMIIPSRWFAGGMGLDQFREKMLKCHKIQKIVDYPNAKECFPSSSIGGGVCYFLWNKSYHGLCEFISMRNGIVSVSMRDLSEGDVFIRDNEALSIVNKVSGFNERSLVDLCSSLNPFSIPSSKRGNAVRTPEKDIRLLSSDGFSYISRSEVTSGDSYIDKWKVAISKVTSEHAGEPDKNGQYKVLSRAQLLAPNEVCTFSYFIAGNFGDFEAANNLVSYLKTKFVRYLLLQSVTSINLSKDKFRFVPQQDFANSWTDEVLYSKYGLSQDEIDYIESTIKEMK